MELEAISGVAMAAFGVRNDDILGILYELGSAGVETLDIFVDERLIRLNPCFDFPLISDRLSFPSLASL